jgi:hypothetical protein
MTNILLALCFASVIEPGPNSKPVTKKIEVIKPLLKSFPYTSGVCILTIVKTGTATYWCAKKRVLYSESVSGSCTNSHPSDCTLIFYQTDKCASGDLTFNTNKRIEELKGKCDGTPAP